MKISFKINLLLLAGVLALTVVFTLSSKFKTRELKYHSLTEDVGKLRTDVLNALIHEKNYEKKYQGEAQVFMSLKSAIDRLDLIDIGLLENSGQLISIKKANEDFRRS